jgi:hypothetical protein
VKVTTETYANLVVFQTTVSLIASQRGGSEDPTPGGSKARA